VRRRGIRGGLISTLKRDHPRKVYKLTRVGRRVLDAEVERLHDLVAAAQLRTAGVDA
jgi:DNA-binding PadR family transcriptional regulator